MTDDVRDLTERYALTTEQATSALAYARHYGYERADVEEWLRVYADATKTMRSQSPLQRLTQRLSRWWRQRTWSGRRRA